MIDDDKTGGIIGSILEEYYGTEEFGALADLLKELYFYCEFNNIDVKKLTEEALALTTYKGD